MSQESIDAQKLCNAAMLNSRVCEALIELEGMKAENRERERNGLALAHGPDQFEALRVRSGVSWNDAITTLGQNL